MVELKDCKGKVLKNQWIKIEDLKNLELVELKTDNNGKTEAIELRKNHEYKIWFTGDKNMTADSASFKATMPISDVVSLSSYFKQYTSSVKVLDQNKNPLSDVRLNIYKHNGTVQRLNTSMNGTYSWKNEGAERVDSIVANLINHEDASITIPATISGNCVDTVNYMVTLLDKQDSEYIRLDLVLYNFDKYFLRPEGKVELDKLVKYMKSHPDLKVELSSHTDSRGSDKYNLKLSKQRAQSCVDYIVAQGISKKLITAKGYGETKLLNKCKNGVWCSVDDHQMNRRTELKLITPEEVELDNNKLGN
jgi:outer membrane protein OmpA-like peptidoglycan-associated protein